MSIASVTSFPSCESGETRVAPARELLFGAQVRQLRHDEFFHREIARLSLRERMNHLALHLAKYTGQFADLVSGDEQPEPTAISRTLTDSFIISVSAANCLNLHIADRLFEGMGEERSLYECISTSLREEGDIQRDFMWLFLEFSRAVGRLAKACESVDHIEDYPLRKVMAESILRIIWLILVYTEENDMSILQKSNNRLLEVKENYLFKTEFADHS